MPWHTMRTCARARIPTTRLRAKYPHLHTLTQVRFRPHCRTQTIQEEKNRQPLYVYSPPGPRAHPRRRPRPRPRPCSRPRPDLGAGTGPDNIAGTGVETGAGAGGGPGSRAGAGSGARAVGVGGDGTGDDGPGAEEGELVSIYLQHVTQNKIIRDPLQLKLLLELEKGGEGFVSGERHTNGLYIYGGVGTGKTFCMDLFERWMKTHTKTKRWHFHEFMLAIHQRLHEVKCSELESELDSEPSPWESQSSPLYQPLESHSSTPLESHSSPLYQTSQTPIVKVAKEHALLSGGVLCLDEFQVTDIGDAIILKQLLQTLFHCGTFVVFTSNRPPNDLYKNGLNRHLFAPCIKMINNTCNIVNLGQGVDYRSLRRRDTGVCPDLYLMPPTCKAHDTWMHKIIQLCEQPESIGMGVEESIREGEGIPVSLAVSRTQITVPMGRTLLIEKAKLHSVCEVSFSDICTQEKSAHDYIGLSNAFPAILLTDVPLMSSMDPDPLRRFITFLDAMYEGRNLLAISSRFPLSQLTATKSAKALRNTREEAVGSNSGSDEAAASVSVVGLGGSSGRSTTMIGDTEWSATGLSRASLAGLMGSMEADFAQARAASRLDEMLSTAWFQDFFQTAKLDRPRTSTGRN